MKHVLFVISSLRGGGAERVLSVLVNELIKKEEFKITILVITDDSVAYEIDECITIQCIDYQRGRSRVLNTLKRLWALRQSIKKIAPDLIITFATEVSVNTFYVTRGLNIPIIASEHCVFFSWGTVYDALRKYAFQRVQHIACLNQHDYKELLAINPNTHIIYNPSPFGICRDCDTSLRKPYAICVGSIGRYDRKGIDKLIIMWKQLAKDLPSFKLHILGSGPDEKMAVLNDLIRREGLEEIVILEGFQQNLEPWYRQATLLVSASIMESFSMTLLEAQSMGCPVISFDCPYGPREIITHDHNGILVPNQDNDALREAIISLYNNHEKQKTLSANALVNAERFAKDRIANEWADLIHKTL